MLNLVPRQHDEKSKFQRGLTSLYDLTYLLAVVPRPDQWNSRPPSLTCPPAAQWARCRGM